MDLKKRLDYAFTQTLKEGLKLSDDLYEKMANHLGMTKEQVTEIMKSKDFQVELVYGLNQDGLKHEN